MIQIMQEKIIDGKDMIKVIIVGKPNQSINQLKSEHKKYIPNELLNRDSHLKNNSENKDIPVFSFWRIK